MIIVTGGAGMIGSNIVAALNAQGETDILVVDDLTDGRKYANLADLRIADYLDRDLFLSKVSGGADFGPIDVLYHQGACSKTTEWNGSYMMTVNYEYSKAMLGFAQRENAPFIYASSAATYGNRTKFVEGRANELPLNVYGYSKLLFDDYVRRRIADVTVPVVGLRYFNVYGPREGHKETMASVAYHLFNQIMAGETARLFGAHGNIQAGMQSRDFIHVEDVASVNLWAAEAGVSGVFNCGTGRSQPFRTVAETMIKAMGRGQIEFIDFPEHLVGRYQNFTQADLGQLRAAGCAVQFRPVEEGVAQYAQWLAARHAEGIADLSHGHAVPGHQSEVKGRVAAFLDRDGTIIVDKHYLGDPDGVEFETGALAGLGKLAAMGLRLVGVTNQSGIARGMFDLAAANSVNDRINALLAEHGLSIEQWYLCPHDGNAGCGCRKPAPGMILQAASELGLDAARGFVIGDKLSDVAAAHAVGAHGILVMTGEGASVADRAREQGYEVVSDLAAAADLIRQRLKQQGWGRG